jgi:hypothetical protein
VFAYIVIKLCPQSPKSRTAPIIVHHVGVLAGDGVFEVRTYRRRWPGIAGRLRDEQLNEMCVCDGIGGKSVPATDREKLQKKAAADDPPRPRALPNRKPVSCFHHFRPPPDSVLTLVSLCYDHHISDIAHVQTSCRSFTTPTGEWLDHAVHACRSLPSASVQVLIAACDIVAI